MKSTPCDREPDVLEAVISGCWPPEGSAGDDLRGHARVCPVCADLAAVAVVLRDEGDAARREAPIPTSGQVWWRATMRTRTEAAAAAARPITMLHGLAGVCGAGLCAALVTQAWPTTGRPLAWIATTLSREGERIAAAAVSAAVVEQALLSLAVVLGAALILSPFLLYFVLTDE